MDGGLLAIRADGEVVTARRRAGTVFVINQKTSDEEAIGSGEQPWMLANSNGTYVVWTSKREGELLLAKIESRSGRTLPLTIEALLVPVHRIDR